MSDIEFFIDGVKVTAKTGQSILEASLEAGIYIPNICSHPDLSPQGECKLCVVELNGKTALSCQTKPEPGMNVISKSDKLHHLRVTAIELMLACHPHDCTSCVAYLNCELQAMMQYLGAAHSRLRDIHKKNVAINNRNPLIIREMERCIQCGRCVRACSELRDVGILDYLKRDGETYIGTAGDLPLKESDCRFCGACVAVCPTGALRMDAESKTAAIPCQAACPADIDIPRYVRLVREGKYSEAAAVVREKAPFPLTLGYVCSNLCEKECRRKELNQAISIRELKKFAAENDREQIWKKNHTIKPSTGKKVAIVGSGITGMTAAYYLSTQGHKVTVFERLPVPGGMMASGIPEYRLPRDIVQSEIDTIRDNGVEVITSCSIGSIDELFEKSYDAVLIATGTPAGKKIPLPGADRKNVYAALDILRAASLGQDLAIGKSVTVLGGGNVAFDAARVCVRLGAEKVNLLCLEADGKMLADKEEIIQGKEEGIEIHNSKSTLSLELDGGDLVSGVKCIDVESFSFGPGGKLELKTKAGSEQVIPSDTVVFAVGQKTDLNAEFGVELTPFGYVKVKENSSAASRPGVFAAGDVVTGTRFLIEGVAGGRKAAAEIDAFLGGSGAIDEKLAPDGVPEGKIGKLRGFPSLERNFVRIISPTERVSGFGGICLPFDRDQAFDEAKRCLQCDLRTRVAKNKLWTEYMQR